MKGFALQLVLVSALFGFLDAAGADLDVRHAPARIELRDQFDTARALSFPHTNVVLLAIADRDGSDQVNAWIKAVKPRLPDRVEIRGLADVSGVPALWRERVRRHFRQTRQHPVMLDWSGRVCAALEYQPRVANLLVLAEDGAICGRVTGPATAEAQSRLVAIFEAALRRNPAAPSTGAAAGGIP